jgi:hypothetical protein
VTRLARRLLAAVLLSAVLLNACAPASARIPIVETDAVELSFGGYFRTVMGFVTADCLKEPCGPDSMGLSTAITRTELKLSVLETVTVDAHARLLWRVASLPIFALGGGSVGAGASVAPPRWINLSWSLLGSNEDDPSHRLDLDIDRLALRLFLGDVDLTIGRQAITWGNSTMLPPADLWTAFSPFDLDSSQKRGIDGLRAVWGLTSDVELDFVLVDRGTLHDLSGGVRTVIYTAWGDVWAGAAKSYEQVGLMAGVAAEVDVLTLRAEAFAGWDLDKDAIRRPRVTLGVDWFQSADFMLAGEVHYSGLGGDLKSLGRGEIYLSREWYVGLLATYKLTELLSLSLTPIINAEADPSALIAWNIGYSIAQDVDISLGAFHGAGASTSEFGATGHFVFLQLAAFL